MTASVEHLETDQQLIFSGWNFELGVACNKCGWNWIVMCPMKQLEQHTVCMSKPDWLAARLEHSKMRKGWSSCKVAPRQMMKEDHEMAASCIFNKREGGVDEASISGAHSSRLAVNAWRCLFSLLRVGAKCYLPLCE